MRGEYLRQKWDRIPTGTTVLMTHGPPVGHGDLCLPRRENAGCVDLLAEIQTVFSFTQRVHRVVVIAPTCC